jgi:diguanylate cyclase (GGDEF)-like protein
MDVTERTRAEREVQALQQQLREQSTHDALTGLYNRRYLEENLGRELIRAKRDGYCVSVVMGDIDHFKAVNDRYGHLAGDEALRVFGELMRGNSRSSDINCRYGGEEFLLVLPGMTELTASKRAERLRLIVAKTPVKFGTMDIAITASFGVSEFPQHGENSDELIAAADKSLYAAKEAGRNQVKGYSSFGDSQKSE